MGQSFMWGNMPADEAARGIERLAHFLLDHDLGAATHKMVLDMFEPGGLIRELATCDNWIQFHQITTGTNPLRSLLFHVKPALQAMENKGYSPQVAEFREMLSRIGQWEFARPEGQHFEQDRDIADFIRRGFPELSKDARPLPRPLPPGKPPNPSPYGPYGLSRA